MKLNRFGSTALAAALAAISSAAWATGNAPSVIAQAQQSQNQPAARSDTQRAMPAQDTQRTQRAPATQDAQRSQRAPGQAQQGQAQQGQAAQRSDASRLQAGRTGTDMRASEMIGMDLRNAQGEDVGTIEELMVDVNNQRVHYAVVAFGGFLGLGEKLFAFPVRSLQANGNEMVLNVPRERLENAPGFARNLWPDWGNDRYEQAVDSYHGPDVALERRDNVRLVRASELMGKDVRDQQGETVGEIDELVIDLHSAEVRYVVLDFDRGWSRNNSLVALPLEVLSMPQGTDDDAVIHAPRQLVNMAQGFDRNNWPDVNDRRFRRNIDQQLPAYRPWTNGGGDRGRADGQMQQPQQSQQRSQQQMGRQTQQQQRTQQSSQQGSQQRP